MSSSNWMCNVTLKIPEVGLLECDVDNFLSKVKPVAKLTVKTKFGRGYNVFDRYEYVGDAEIDDEIQPIVKGDVEIALQFDKENLLLCGLIVTDIFELAKSYGFVMPRASLTRNFW